MRVFDRLAEVGHHHDRATDTIESLPPRTIWAVAADAEYNRDGQLVVLDGVLSHDGATLRFIAWSGRRVLEASFDEVTVMRRRNGRLHLQTPRVVVKFEPFYPLGETVEEVPEYAAKIAPEDPFAGLLSWIPSAAFVL